MVCQDQQNRRIAYTAVRVEAQLSGLGQRVVRGQPVVLVSGHALAEAQELYIGLTRLQRAGLADESPDLIELAKKALTRLRFSKSQIEKMAMTGEPLDPVPVLSPWAGIVTEVLDEGSDAEPWASLFGVSDQLMLNLQAAEPEAAFIQEGQMTSILLPDLSQMLQLRIGKIHLPRMSLPTRTIEAEVTTAPEAPLPSQPFTIEFTLEGTRAVGWSRAQMWADLEENHTGRRVYGQLMARNDEPMWKVSPTLPLNPVLPLAVARPRPIANYKPLPTVQWLKRRKPDYEIALTAPQWDILGIKTYPVEQRSFRVYVDCTGTVAAVPGSEKDVPIIARTAGEIHFNTYKQGDLIPGPTEIATVQCTRPILKLQKRLATTWRRPINPDDAGLADQLLAAGFSGQDVQHISRTRSVLKRMPVLVHQPGVLTRILATDAQQVQCGEIIATLRAANGLVVRCDVPTTEFGKLPSRVAVHLRWLPDSLEPDQVICEVEAVPMLDPQSSNEPDQNCVVIPLPAHVSLEPNRTVRLRILNPASARTAVAIPVDCVASIAGQSHVLLHTKRCTLRLVPVTLGATMDGFIEIITGLGEGEPVVQSFGSIVREHPGFANLLRRGQMHLAQS
jgi:Cu(I)/Ag(I) efflux system membrane fusion protein